MFEQLFGTRRKKSSGKTAKDRLQLVLVQDRVKLSPERMEMLKDDLIEVISKYVEIDRSGIEITLASEGRNNHLMADIPVVRSKA